MIDLPFLPIEIFDSPPSRLMEELLFRDSSFWSMQSKLDPEDGLLMIDL